MRRGLSSILFRCQLDQLGVECPQCRLVGGRGRRRGGVRPEARPQEVLHGAQADDGRAGRLSKRIVVERPVDHRTDGRVEVACNAIN